MPPSLRLCSCHLLRSGSPTVGEIATARKTALPRRNARAGRRRRSVCSCGRRNRTSPRRKPCPIWPEASRGHRRPKIAPQVSASAHPVPSREGVRPHVRAPRLNSGGVSDDPGALRSRLDADQHPQRHREHESCVSNGSGDSPHIRTGLKPSGRFPVTAPVAGWWVGGGKSSPSETRHGGGPGYSVRVVKHRSSRAPRSIRAIERHRRAGPAFRGSDL